MTLKNKSFANTEKNSSAKALEENEMEGELSEVIDVQKGLERTMGDRPLFQELITEFSTMLPQTLSEIEGAISSGNNELISRLAHRLKGAAGSLSAIGITQTAQALEQTAIEGAKSGSIRFQYDALSKAAERFLKLKKFILNG